MDFFSMLNEIRLKSTHHEKYLVAEKDEETVSQDRKGKSSKTSTWNVELVQGGGFIRLKSCYGTYLTALDVPFHLGVNGKKVVQTFPTGMMDSCSIEWEPIRDGHQYKLKSRCGEYLRANGGLPPWRNSVTHDVPHRSSTQDWILWEVDILDHMQVQPIIGGGGVANEKEEKEAKPKDQKKQAAKAAKLLAGVLLKPKRKKGGKSKEEKTEEEVEEEEEEEEEEESGSGSESESESEEEEEEGEGEGGGEGEGEGHSRFGFRKFLHTLNDAINGEEGEGEGEGGGGEGEGEGEGGGFNFEFEF